MTRIEIHTYLAKKVEAAWTAYEEAMLQRPARSIFAKAGEIDAARTCFEELTLNAARRCRQAGSSYPVLRLLPLRPAGRASTPCKRCIG